MNLISSFLRKGCKKVEGKVFSTLRVGGLFLTAIGPFLFLSCESHDFDGVVRKPNGNVADPKELSAGLSTVFSSASDAYDTNSEWVEGEMLKRFNSGDALYDNSRGPVMSWVRAWDRCMEAIRVGPAIGMQGALALLLLMEARAKAFRPCWSTLRVRRGGTSLSMVEFCTISLSMA